MVRTEKFSNFQKESKQALRKALCNDTVKTLKKRKFYDSLLKRCHDI